MKQNIYDNPQFFKGYIKLRETNNGLNDILEQPVLRTLLPRLEGLKVLDIGCGMGQFTLYCAQQGATKVIGADISNKMIEFAKKHNDNNKIEFICCAVEDLSFKNESFNLVVSSLVLHYVKNYREIISKIYKILDVGGIFIFSMEHPVVTSQNPMQGWILDEQGKKTYWPVDYYSKESERKQSWFIDGVIKYHRKMETIINELIEVGFQIECIKEPEVISEFLVERPELEEHSRRPPFLIVKCIKK